MGYGSWQYGCCCEQISSPPGGIFPNGPQCDGCTTAIPTSFVLTPDGHIGDSECCESLNVPAVLDWCGNSCGFASAKMGVNCFYSQDGLGDQHAIWWIMRPIALEGPLDNRWVVQAWVGECVPGEPLTPNWCLDFWSPCANANGVGINAHLVATYYGPPDGWSPAPHFSEQTCHIEGDYTRKDSGLATGFPASIQCETLPESITIEAA